MLEEQEQQLVQRLQQTYQKEEEVIKNKFGESTRSGQFTSKRNSQNATFMTTQQSPTQMKAGHYEANEETGGASNSPYPAGKTNYA